MKRKYVFLIMLSTAALCACGTTAAESPTDSGYGSFNYSEEATTEENTSEDVTAETEDASSTQQMTDIEIILSDETETADTENTSEEEGTVYISDEMQDEIDEIAEEYDEYNADLAANTTYDEDGNPHYYADYFESDFTGLTAGDIIEEALEYDALLETDMDDGLLKSMVVYAASVYGGGDIYTCNESDVTSVKDGLIYSCLLHNDTDSMTVLVDISNIKLKLVTGDTETVTTGVTANE